MPTSSGASLVSDWRNVKWCLYTTKFVFFFSPLSLYWDLCGRLSLLSSRCLDQSERRVEPGLWSPGAAQVIQILNAYKTRGEICLPWVWKVRTGSNHCFIATNGKINLFVPVGNLAPAVRKPELCLDILIAEWMQSSNLLPFDHLLQ